MEPFFKGVAFAFDMASTGIFSKKTDEDVVRDSIKQILLTGRGSRVMRRSYGCGVMSVLFDNMGPFLESVIIEFVSESLRNFEPRITVNDITVTSGGVEGTTIDVLVGYTFNGRPDNVKITMESGQ